MLGSSSAQEPCQWDTFFPYEVQSPPYRGSLGRSHAAVQGLPYFVFFSWLPRVRRVSAPQNKRFGFEKNCECNRTNNIMALQLLPCSTHRMQTSWPTKCTPHRSTADPQGVMLRRRRCRTYLMFPCKYHDNQRLCTSNHDSTVFFLRQNEGDARRIVLPKHQTNGNLKRKHDCMVAG